MSYTSPALPSSQSGSDASQKPFTAVEHNRITVVTARPKASPASSDAPGGAAPAGSQQKLFNAKHATLKEACIDWINSRLGQDATLKSKNLVPVTATNLVEKCGDGILLWYVFIPSQKGCAPPA